MYIIYIVTVDTPKTWGSVMFATIMVLVILIGSLSHNVSFKAGMDAGFKLRSVVTTLIYRKVNTM